MLHLHRSERADGLVAMLAGLLCEPLDDPLATEVVAVPTRGVERWLNQQLATHLGASSGRHDGVCANVDFPFPGRVVGDALALGGGVDPRDDPWSPARSVWPLLEVVEECLGESWLAPLAGHLQQAAPPGEERRFATVRHIADLYDRYGVHRPAMVRAWLSGTEDPGAGWQPELWRRLRARLATPSPAERLVDACAHLVAEPELLGYPPRLSMFGLTRLPASYLDVLDAVAATRDVHLFLLHPSPVLWEKVAATLGAPTRGTPRLSDATASLVQSSLLASWGRDAREMQLVLRGPGDRPVADHHRPVDAGRDDLLHLLQADVRADRSPPGAPAPGEADGRPVLGAGDASVQVHGCHGRGRQVEVVRDAVLHLLEADPTLEPRDVIVMCPDIDRFAPLIQATFGSYDPEDTGRPAFPDLRVRLADRSLRQTNPLLGVLSDLLDLAASRVTATEVLDLAGREPVRRRFHLGDDDLSRLEEWVTDAGVRWGLSAAQRAPFRLEAVGANTWRAGLDRALLGVGMADERQRTFGGTVPLDDVQSGDIELMGRLAELVDRLGAGVERLSSRRPVDQWAAALGDLTDALTATSDQDAWQRVQLQNLLDGLADEATYRGSPSPVALGPGDIRSLLADRLRGRPTRANFRTGHLTVCTLVPMRSVPHRVVCLLGLDDGAFPRQVAVDGDDLVARKPRVGDNDRRSEDRQLLLDALLAATEHLVVAYSAHDDRTNLARPPAVPLGELLDVIDGTVRTDDGRPARGEILVDHPLQPFDVREFSPGALSPGGPWSFDAVNLAGARASLRPRHDQGPWLPAPLDDLPMAAVELQRLLAFLHHPVRAFLRDRLDVTLADYAEDVSDAMPVEVDGLAAWDIAERMLTARLAGAPRAACEAAERARGALPPGALGDAVLDHMEPTIERLVALGHRDAPLASLQVNVAVPSQPPLVGTAAGVHGDTLLRVSYSKLAPHHRLEAWVGLLALSAAWPDRRFDAVTIGRRPDNSRPGRTLSARIAPLGRDAAERRSTALAHLAVVVDLYRRGMREPLPLFDRTSAAWASAVLSGEDPAGRAGEAWNSKFRVEGEGREPEHRLVFGGDLAFEQMVARGGPPPAHEDGDGWERTENTRAGRLARRLWDGLLAHEVLDYQ